MRSKQGFTLVEVVVVLGIVMILYAILAPVFTSARLRAQETVCASNLHQTWLAMEIYRQDYGEFDTLQSQLQPYLKSRSVLLCPLEYRSKSELYEFNQVSPDEKNPVLSSYIYPATPPHGDYLYKRRGEQAPAIICDIHTLRASGIPFYQVIRYNGGLSRVPDIGYIHTTDDL